MSGAKGVIAQLLALRESWCELEHDAAGQVVKRVKLRRPAEAEMPQFYRGVTIDAVKRYAVGWEGFSEAALFGASVGSADALAFDADLWAEVVSDNTEWLQACTQHLAKQISDHLIAKDAAAKNSQPSSTPAPASN